MATVCAAPFRIPRLRATQLDACGAIVESTCSVVVSDGVMSVAISREYEDREDFYKKDGDGQFCIQDTAPQILKWINLEMTFCNVNPQLANFLGGVELVYDDDDTGGPNVVGFRESSDDPSNVNVGVEIWSRVKGLTDCGTGLTKYGYGLFPRVIEGTIGDLTIENGLANFVLSARTAINNQWGVGPYAIRNSQATATLGDPLPLLTAIGTTDHEHWEFTTLQYPIAACECAELPLPLTAVPTGLSVDVTLPTGVLPAYIDWGDTNTETVTTGPTANHVYGGAGTYIIQLFPTTYSSQAYEASVTVA